MKSRPTRQPGFSLLELLICMAVMMVVTVAAFPTISKNLQIYRLQSSAQEVATLLQRTRILAVKSNTTYSIATVTTSAGIQEFCIDSNSPPDGTCQANEPLVALATNVSLVTDGSGPSTSQITCGSVGPTTCPSGVTGLNYQPQGVTAWVSYNDRGLPCVGSPSTTEPNGTACNENVVSASSSTPVGFLYEFQYASSSGKSYAAVSVTPAGLVTVWLYSGSTWGQI